MTSEDNIEDLDTVVDNVSPEEVKKKIAKKAPKAVKQTPKPPVEPEQEDLEEEDLNIEEDLEEESSREVEDTKSTGTPKTNSLAGMLKNITPEMANELRDILEKTPRIKSKVESKPVIDIRSIGGKFIVDTKTQINIYAIDQNTGLNRLSPVVPVKFFGENDFVNVDYLDFVNADKHEVPIINTTTEMKEEIEGDTFREDEDGLGTDEIKALVTVYIVTKTTVRLPSGEESIIEESAIN